MRLLALLLLLSPLAARAQVQDDDLLFQQEAAKFKVAVLGIKAGGVSPALTEPLRLISLTDDLRNEAPRIVPGLGVMTKESMNALIEATGQDASKCEGLCAVDLGRLVQADYVTDGNLARLGSQFEISLSLYETGSGRLLSGVKATGADYEQLSRSVKEAAKELFGKLKASVNMRVLLVKQAEKRKAEAEAEANRKAEADRQLALTRESNAAAEARRREAREAIDTNPRKTVFRWVGWGVLGGGVVLGALAGISVIDGKVHESKIKDGVGSLKDLAEFDQIIKDDNSKAKAFGIAAPVVAAIGFVLLLTQHPLSDEELAAKQTQLAVVPGGLLLAGKF